MKFSMLALMLLLGSGLIALSDEIWITPVGTDNTGSGTAADPWVRSSASSFDAEIGLVTDMGYTGVDAPVTSSIPTNSTIHLMAGTFLTHGYINIKAGWKIRGSGIDVTIIQEQPWIYGFTNLGKSDGWFFPVFANATVDGIEISDLTIDCDVQASTNLFGASAVNLAGANNRISRLKAVNWGTRGGGEVFVFEFDGDNSRIATNCVMDDCIVGPPAQITFQAGVGADGFAIFGYGDQYVDNGWMADSEIRNCSISTITTGAGIGQPHYFHGIVGGNVNGFKVDGNRIMGVEGPGFYASCGSAYNWIIENNLFMDVSAGVNIVGSDACGTNNYTRNNISVLNNYITIKGTGGAIGLGAYTDGNPNNRATNFIVTGNTVLPADSSSSTLGVVFANADQVTFNNNTINGVGGNGLGFNNANSTFSSMTGNFSTTGANVSPSGNPSDYQTFIFTPTNGPGWYRITEPFAQNYMAGDLRITRDFSGSDNTANDIEMEYDVSGYTSNPYYVGNINLLHKLQYGGGGGVQAARVGCIGAGSSVYVDLYLGTAATDAPIKIQYSGGENAIDSFMGAYGLTTYPFYMGTTNMPQACKVLSFGGMPNGLMTSGTFMAGTNSTVLNGSSGKILNSAMNILQPNKGGLGLDASSWAPNMMPYTTGTGTFGAKPVLFYILPPDAGIENFTGPTGPAVTLNQFTSLNGIGNLAWLCPSNSNASIIKSIPLPNDYWGSKLNYVSSWKIRTTVPGNYSFEIGVSYLMTNDVGGNSSTTVTFTAPSTTNTVTLTVTNSSPTVDVNALDVHIYTGNIVQPGDYSILGGAVSAY